MYELTESKKIEMSRPPNAEWCRYIGLVNDDAVVEKEFFEARIVEFNFSGSLVVTQYGKKFLNEILGENNWRLHEYTHKHNSYKGPRSNPIREVTRYYWLVSYKEDGWAHLLLTL